MQWKKINDRKWELRHENLLVASIFHKPLLKKFSLFVQAPRTYKRVMSVAAESYLYDTIEEAQDGFVEILTGPIAAYVRAMQAAIDECRQGKLE